MPNFSDLDLTTVSAAWIDSCITSPREPVLITCPFPGTYDASIVNNSPPTSVHANPETLPTISSTSASPNLNLGTPQYFSKFLGVILIELLIVLGSASTLSLTDFLKIFAICLSRLRTPASLV